MNTTNDQHPSAWHSKGMALARQGEFAAAVPYFVQALNLKPDFVEACYDLAVSLERMGQTAMAIDAYEHWLTIEQSLTTPPHVSLSGAQQQELARYFSKGEAGQKQGDHAQAIAAFSQVLALHPGMPEALVNLGVSLHYLRRYPEADQALIQAVRSKPGFAEALNILASNYASLQQTPKAIAAWRQALKYQPKHVASWLNLAKALSGLEDFSGAISAYEEALKLAPDHCEALSNMLHMLYNLCRWERAGEIEARLQKAFEKSTQWVEPFLLCVHLPQLQLANAKRYSAHFFPRAKSYDSKRALPSVTRGHGKLRIGYLSSDYYRHATAHLISELFEKHDRNHFEVFAYSHGAPDSGPEQARIRNAVDHFYDISASDDDTAAQQIEADGIDILIDLKGYTRGQRLSLMAHRPAPIQMHYLGYPGTIGAPFIDYFIADEVSAPPAADEDFCETLIRLPGSYQINDRSRPLPAAAKPREAYGLPASGLVFCDFNNAYKITPMMFAAWMRLLARTPGSVLWVYETHPEATANLRAQAQAAAIDPGRIIAAQKLPMTEHLARYHHVDLFLDSSPVCGHTTASDALWCGAPVLTLAGEAFVSRVAAGLLAAVGLPELITTSLADYEARAWELASNPAQLVALRAHLERGRMAFSLFDSTATTKALENAYFDAAKRHRNDFMPGTK